MIHPHDPDRGAKPSDAGLDDGLRAAFGSAAQPRSSVRRILEDRTGSRLGLHLHSAETDEDSPVRVDDAVRALRDPSGRYHVVGEIGRGGVGIVYKSHDQDLGRDVAMKVLRPEYVDRPEVVERFVEEAQIGGQLQHPGIVPVYEIGLQHGDRPYFAMKLVKGETLAAMLARRAHAGDDRRRFLGIFEQICQTLAYAHARRVVHRDLKPSNVMLGSFGEVQVVDWGFAKVLPRGGNADEAQDRQCPSTHASVIETVRSNPEKCSHSAVGSVLGTPAYMPPEQAIGDVERMDERSDVFGLGAILCEILTGEPPYREADGDVVQQAARGDLAGAHERIEGSGADATLVVLCRQCLSPAPQSRPESAKQVADAVSGWLHAVEERAQQALVHAAEAKVRARATVLLAAAAVLLLALGGGAWAYVQREAQARREQAGQRVARASGEAAVRAAEARDRNADGASWQRAIDAARHAEELAGEPEVAQEQLAAARSFAATVVAEGEAAQARAARIAKEAAMRALLVDARIPTDDEVLAKDRWVVQARTRCGEYAAAFAFYLDGRDVLQLEVLEVALALRGALDIELAAALDHWAGALRFLARRGQLAPPHASRHLQAIAAALDPDPWRGELRDRLSVEPVDATALEALATNALSQDLPAVSLHMLGAALWNAERLPAAHRVYSAAHARFPADFGISFQLARLCRQMRDHSGAIAAYRAAAALRPDLREVQHQLGMVANDAGDHAVALEVFSALARSDAGNAHWLEHIAEELVSLRRFPEGVEVAKRAVAVEPATSSRHRFGVVLEMSGDVVGAERVLREALELAPGDPRLLGTLGRMSRHQRRLEESLALHQQAVATRPDDTFLLHGLATVLADMGKADEAIACHERALAIDPEDADHLSNLAGLLMRGGEAADRAAAAVLCRRALAINGRQAIAHNNLGVLLLQDGRVAEAEHHMRRATEASPQMAMAFQNLGHLLVANGDAAGAVAALERALELDPTSLSARIDIARAFELRGDKQAALDHLRAAIDAHPDAAAAHNNLGNLCMDLGESDAALASLERCLAIDPEFALAHYNIGLWHRRRGETDAALVRYRRSVELDPTYVPALMNLGNLLRDRGEHVEALLWMRRALLRAPEDPQVLNNLGDLLRTRGEVDEAVDVLRRTLELHPQRTMSAGNLGLALAARGDHEAAIPHYRAAVDGDAQGLGLAGSLALSLAHVGRRGDAVEVLQEAKAHAQAGPAVLLEVGVVLQRLGAWDDAIASYRRASELARAAPRQAQPLRNVIEQRLAAMESLIDKQSFYEEIADGAHATAAPQDRVVAAEWMYARGEYARATAVWAQAFTADPEVAEHYPHRYNAACAAVLAGAPTRPTAAQWLAAELQRWQAAAAEGGQVAQQASEQVSHCLRDPDFAAVRGDEALAGLPPGEASVWHELWQRIEALAPKQARGSRGVR